MQILLSEFCHRCVPRCNAPFLRRRLTVNDNSPRQTSSGGLLLPFRKHHPQVPIILDRDRRVLLQSASLDASYPSTPINTMLRRQ